MARPKPLEKLMQTGYRLSSSRKKELEDIAASRGQSLQAVIDEAVEFRLMLTGELWDQYVARIEETKKNAVKNLLMEIIKEKSK